ncbi:MAG TPA: hypothetical protein PLH98_06650 [Ruminococcus flavefaciens]|nr:hypothetical protein [Ruminococcus flavefaciens]HQM00227.1 hypothetical protein [Ruminococcus flavefaciens]
MKKKLCVGVAALLITISSYGCSDSKKNDVPTKDIPAVTEAAESTTENNIPPQEDPPEVKFDLDAEYDESKYLHYVDMPECTPTAAAEANFIGLWQADVMAKDNIAYDSICGIPVSATGHLVIAEEGSGNFVNIDPVVISDESQGGAPQTADAAGQSGSKADETELPMTYTFENGALNAAVSIPVGPPKNEQAAGVASEAAAVQGPPPKQMLLQMTDDGRILVQSADEDGTITSAYYKKVDSFEEFDWSSVNFDFASAYEY